MTDPTEHEIVAVEHAGAMAGEYLESLGRTDLSTLSREEWLTLMAVIVGGFQDRMMRGPVA